MKRTLPIILLTILLLPTLATGGELLILDDTARTNLESRIATTTDYVATNAETGLLDIQLSRGENKLLIKELATLDTIEYAKIIARGEHPHQELTTNIAYAILTTPTKAEITLRKHGTTNTILKCELLNTLTNECNEWTTTKTPYTQNNTHITFTINEFSAYAGTNNLEAQATPKPDSITLLAETISFNDTTPYPFETVEISVSDALTDCEVNVTRPDGYTNNITGIITGTTCAANYTITYLNGTYSVIASTNGTTSNTDTFTTYWNGSTINITDFTVNDSTYYPGTVHNFSWYVNDTEGNNITGLVTTLQDPNLPYANLDTYVEIYRQLVNVYPNGTKIVRIYVEGEGHNSVWDYVDAGTEVNITLTGPNGTEALDPRIKLTNSTFNGAGYIITTLTNNSGTHLFTTTVTNSFMASSRGGYVELEIPAEVAMTDIIARVDDVRHVYFNGYTDYVHIAGVQVSSTESPGGDDGNSIYGEGDYYPGLGYFPLYLSMNPNEEGTMYASSTPDMISITKNLTATENYYESIHAWNDYTSQDTLVSVYAEKWGYDNGQPQNITLTYDDPAPADNRINISNVAGNTTYYFPEETFNLSWNITDTAGTPITGLGQTLNDGDTIHYLNHFTQGYEIKREILSIGSNGEVIVRLYVEHDVGLTGSETYSGTYINITILNGTGDGPPPPGITIQNLSSNAGTELHGELKNESGVYTWNTKVTATISGERRSNYLEFTIPNTLDLSDIIFRVDEIYYSYDSGHADYIVIAGESVNDGNLNNEDGYGSADDGLVIYKTGDQFGALGELPLYLPLSPSPDGITFPYLSPDIERLDDVTEVSGRYEIIQTWHDYINTNLTAYIYADKWGYQHAGETFNLTLNPTQRTLNISNISINTTKYVPGIQLTANVSITDNTTDLGVGNFNRTEPDNAYDDNWVKALELRREIIRTNSSGVTVRLTIEYDTGDFGGDIYSGSGFGFTIFDGNGTGNPPTDITITNGTINDGGQLTETLTNTSGVITWVTTSTANFKNNDREAYIDFLIPNDRTINDIILRIDNITFNYAGGSPDTIQIGDVTETDSQLNGGDDGTVTYFTGDEFGALGELPIYLSLAPDKGALILNLTSASSNEENVDDTLIELYGNYSQVHNWTSDIVEDVNANFCASKWGYNNNENVCSGIAILERPKPMIVNITENTTMMWGGKLNQNITFYINWSLVDEPSEPAKVFFCTTSEINVSGCAATTFCNTSFSATKEQSCNYTIPVNIDGNQSYWALLCTDSGSCGNISSEYLFYTNSSGNIAPIINSHNTTPVLTYQYLVTKITANVTDVDNNVHSVNFTLTAPNGTVMLSNVNGTNYGDDWNSTPFTLESPGQWNYTIVAADQGGLSDEVNGTINFLEITESLTPSTLLPGESYVVSGKINRSNFTASVNTGVSVYVNGTRTFCDVTGTTSPSWFNTSWRFRQPISVTENSGETQNNYTVAVLIDTNALVDNQKMNADCSDIRFGDSSGNEISHWLDNNSQCNTTTSRYWVKVPTINALSTETIYMYYGNSEASDTGDASSAWVWYDEFDTNTLSQYSELGETWAWNAGGYITDSETANTEATIVESTINISDILVETRVRQTDNDGVGAIARHASLTQFYSCGAYDQSDLAGIGEGEVNNWINSSSTTSTSTDWIELTLRINGSTIWCDYNNSAQAVNITYKVVDTSLVNGSFGLVSSYNDPAAHYQYLRARAYTYPEPTTSAGGSEENALQTNATGEYSCTLTAPASPGDYEVLVNSTSGSEYGQMNQTLTVAPPGTISVALITPTTNISVNESGSFIFTANISCSGGDCENVTASLDPISDTFWNYSYEYRQAINVSPNTPTEQGYSVLVIVNSTTSGTNWDWSNSCQDIAFANQTGNTRLAHWVENCSSTDELAYIWVTLDHNITEESTPYMYYGGTGNPDYSNVSETFIDDQLWYMAGDCINTCDSSMDNHAAGDDIRENINNTNYEVDGTAYDTLVLHNDNPFGSNDDTYYERFRFLFVPNTTASYGFGVNNDDAAEATISQSDAYGGGWATTHPFGAHDVVATWYGAHGTGTCGTSGSPGSRNLVAGEGYWIDYLFTEAGSGEYLQMCINDGTGYATVSTTNFPEQLFSRKYAFTEPTITLGAEEEGLKYGLVSTTAGTKPFYANGSNPYTPINYTCLDNMDEGDYCVVSWNVTSTGSAGIIHEFYAYANSSVQSVTDGESTHFNVTITAIPRGYLNLTLITPTTNTNVIQNETFVFTTNVTCVGIAGSICGNVSMYIDPENWWNASWKYRKELTINSTISGEDLENFTILVVLNSTRIDYSQTQNNGEDIRFVDANTSALLDYEIELWDESGSSYVWVEVPTIDASSTTDSIWMYYGNLEASDAQNPSGTWSEDWVGVWHLGEDPTGGTPQFNDSTVNDNDMQHQGSMDGDSSVTSPIGNALLFDNVNNYLTGTITGGGANTNTVTMMAWFTTEGTTSYEGILYSDVSEQGIILTGATDNPFGFRWDGGSDEYNENTLLVLSTSIWYYGAVVLESNAAAIYMGNQSGALNNHTNANANSARTINQAWRIGQDDYNAARRWNGNIDEVRLSNVSKSENWIELEHQSQANNILTFNEEEVGSKNGSLVSTETGDTPFYTTTNPYTLSDYSCLENMTGGNTCQVSWTVNTTGEINSTHEFYVYATSNDGDVEQNQSNSINLTIVAGGNSAPVIVDVESLSAQTPLSNGTRSVLINFSVVDSDGVADLVDASAFVLFNNSVVSRNGSCGVTDLNATGVRYNCSVGLLYYDLSGVWSINVSVNDTSGVVASNSSTSFVVNELLSVAGSLGFVSFGSLSPGSSSGAVNDPLVLANLGNVNLTEVNVTGYELRNGSSVFGADNFSVNVVDSSGTSLMNGSAVTVGGSFVDLHSDGSALNESLFFWVSVPSVDPLTYVSVSDWVVSAGR